MLRLFAKTYPIKVPGRLDEFWRDCSLSEDDQSVVHFTCLVVKGTVTTLLCESSYPRPPAIQQTLARGSNLTYNINCGYEMFGTTLTD